MNRFVVASDKQFGRPLNESVRSPARLLPNGSNTAVTPKSKNLRSGVVDELQRAPDEDHPLGKLQARSDGLITNSSAIAAEEFRQNAARVLTRESNCEESIEPPQAQLGGVSAVASSVLHSPDAMPREFPAPRSTR